VVPGQRSHRSVEGAVLGVPRLLLRLEGAALLAVCIVLYWKFGSSWWLFVVLLLAPDLGMAGYVRSTRIGAATYNVVHTSALPAVAVAAAVLSGSSVAWSIGLIWLAHIGMDRALGYGLKYDDAFEHTHLGLIGSRRDR
jgi:hypothetical protein